MGRIVICQAGAWDQFKTMPMPDGIFKDNPSLAIIPEGEDKERIAGALPGPGIKAIRTIPQCLEAYVNNRCGKKLLVRHEVESIFSAIMGDSLASYFNIERYKQSYVKAVTDFFYGFRATSLADLRQAIAGLKMEQLSIKEKDLVKIHREYENRLPEYGFDLRSGLEEMLRRAGRGEMEGLPGCGEEEQVLFFGFDYITPLEEEFIVTVCRHAGRAYLFCCGDAEASEQAMRIRQSIAALLRRLEGEGAQRVQLPPPTAAGFFTIVAQALFKAEPPDQEPGASPRPAAGRPQRRETIAITGDNSRAAEVASMARRIRRLNETGVSWRDIRIAAPAYRLYSAVIGEIFPDYGIPFHLEHGAPLAHFPLAAVILRLATQGLSPNPYPLREKIFTSPYVSFTAAITPSHLLEYQEISGVELLSGERLSRLIEPDAPHTLEYSFLKTVRAKAFRTVKPAPGTPQAEVIRRYFDGPADQNSPEQDETRCRYLIQAYLQAQAEKRLSAWPPRLSGGEFAETLRGLLEQFHIAGNIKQGGTDDDSRDSRKAQIASRDRAILERVEQIMAEMAAPPPAPHEPLAAMQPLAELARSFSHLMNEAVLDTANFTSPAEGDGVTVQAVDRGQYQSWPYTFICGMVDGEFPAKEEFNFLQPKKEGLGLGSLYTSVDHGRNRFYQLVRTTTRGLFLSRPLSDQGKKLSPSPFLRGMHRWAGAPAEPADPAAGGQTAARDGVLYSRREKLSCIAREVDCDYARALPLLQELAAEDEPFYRKITATLRFDGLTLNASSLSEFDGLFPPASVAAALLEAEIRNITFTPAVLERYAACPMRFFLDDLLHLRQDHDYHPDTVEAGRLVRSILKEYTAAACAAGGIPAGAPLLLKELAEKHLRELERVQGGSDAFQLRFMNSLTAGLDGQAARRPGLLPVFLRHEREGPDCLRPYWAALTGAVKLKDELEIHLELDRVDLTEAGDYLLACFYTAAPPNDPKRIRRGLRFDLPLAIRLCANLAAEKQVHIPVAGAGLYLVKTAKELRRGGYFALEEIRAARRDKTSPEKPIFSGRREGFLSREDLTAALEKIEEHLLRLHRLMQSGVFHLPLGQEAEQSCGNCSFHRACRKEQLRLEKLKRACGGADAAQENVHLVSEIF